ncbi:uncharacterized protein J4E88_003591 [Alternaria novae-zelandiae]|uniref:uncharacterized protein n=1 Tax=Alternaria novae-zelandiae TaxID=430562 RepID=UPI0020C2A6BA|nr:uncharacterized protein J4E88_003591 [Alternaria novae-zelandiae]KAI4685755.1 hypothetical protein J4E88_003591 [Alternaria novae-zelandiae]
MSHGIWTPENFGWIAVPRNRSNVPSAEDVKEMNNDFYSDPMDAWPVTDLTGKAQKYAQEHLTKETYNHSMRVFCYGIYIIQHYFPEYHSKDFFETWALTCLFHDIGTTDENMSNTHMSFEFQGGLLALTKLQEFGAPKIQAESVAEAIIRHQDPGETGTVSAMVQMIQIATEFDNMGLQPHLIGREVIESVTAQLPRMGWSGCFSSTILKEIRLKPWCHTTALDNFAESVAGNELMRPFE